MSESLNNSTGKKIHIISNTHWDRAWVYPFNETRLLLIEFMDNLLDLLENDPKFHSFLLDSQTIAVEDYLQFRPEKENQIKEYVKSGKLIVGPWYNLPEEYNPVRAQLRWQRSLHVIYLHHVLQQPLLLV